MSGLRKSCACRNSLEEAIAENTPVLLSYYKVRLLDLQFAAHTQSDKDKDDGSWLFILHLCGHLEGLGGGLNSKWVG